jgi:hypothetical protein
MPEIRWDNLVWPRWLPEAARMPLVAQITGAVALTALVMGPWWSRVPSELPAAPVTTIAAPLSAPVSPAGPGGATSTGAGSTSAAFAHLNLDVRHSFGSVNLTVMVDGKRALTSKVEGGGKKFRMFGKRSERSFTRSLDINPGVRVVQVRVQSAADKFDQTRTERFELSSASVASMRITAGKSGLDVVAQHPASPRIAPEPPAPPPQPVTAATTVPTIPTAAPAAQRADAVAELLQSVRSMLIAIAGFVASAATGFVVQEFLRARRAWLFAHGKAPAEPAVERPRGERRRRRRPAPQA